MGGLASWFMIQGTLPKCKVVFYYYFCPTSLIWGLAPYPRALPYIKLQLCNSKGAFTLGFRDSKVKSPYTMQAI
jgi:hypothetical protein